MPFSFAHPALGRALTARLYVEPTTVQAAVMAPEALERDLLVSAQTGSGKTVAFGLALAKRLLGDAERAGPPGAARVLIVTPTRELALQVHRELSWLYADTGVRITTCVGGMDPQRERQALQRGVHVVVGTPGRLCDHLERGALVLARIETIVLDEADEMLDMGFREDLERLLDAAPKERRTLMFSATIPKMIAQLAKRYQKDALRIATVGETDRHRDIEYQAIPILPRERDLAVVNLLRWHDAPGALVFCATRDGVTHLAANLSERGFSVAALSGELSQRERNQALQALRDRRARVCVATDVAARGLDLPDLGLVIHADLPVNPSVLVHRSGRTGRAGKSGTAIVLVPDHARRHAERMLAAAHVRASWRLAPSSDEVRTKDRSLLADEIRAALATPGEMATDDDREVARALLADVGAEELVAALVRSRRESWPAPEELTIPPSMRPQRAPNQTGMYQAQRPPQRPAQRPRDSAPQDSAPRADRPREERPSFGATNPRDGGPRNDGPRANGDRNNGSRTVRPQDRPLPHDRPLPSDHSAPLALPPRDDRPEAGVDRSRVAPGASMVWFTINVGRSKNADPKWLIPLLCRRGDITKKAIGKIQVLAKETRVEIASDAAPQFAIAIQKPDPKDRQIHIEPLDAE